jgi:hypothetical protein
MHDGPTGQRAESEGDRGTTRTPCTLATVQILLHFGIFPGSFLAFHGSMECLNAEAVSQSLPTQREPSSERHH